MQGRGDFVVLGLGLDTSPSGCPVAPLSATGSSLLVASGLFPFPGLLVPLGAVGPPFENSHNSPLPATLASPASHRVSLIIPLGVLPLGASSGL